MGLHTLGARLRVSAIAAVTAGALAPLSPALALPESAPVTSPEPTVGELIITAPHVVRSGARPAWALGAPIEVVSFSETVRFMDLDLTTKAGADEFRERILRASREACAQLDAKYPPSLYVLVPADQNCADTAATPALSVAKEIIEAARTWIDAVRP